MQVLTKTQPSHNVDKQIFNAAGVLLQFLASPEEVGDAICLIRGTMPPGVVVPLHKHAEIELLYVLEGTLEFFMAKDGTQWATAGVGDVIAIPSNVKHALRNRSSLPWPESRPQERWWTQLYPPTALMKRIATSITR